MVLNRPKATRPPIKTNTFVIVGAGVAGASAAEALRGAGYDGRIVLIGDEPSLPYERPPLSKNLLRGESTPEGVLLRVPQFYISNAIEPIVGERVTQLDVRAQRVTCASGVAFAYDNLLIATGGSARRLHVPGAELPGVHYLRTLAHALALRDALAQKPHVLVVGGGFIGCEVAASARALGCEVTIAGPSPPLAHALGSDVGDIYAQYHRAQGVRVRDGVTVSAFRGNGVLEEAVLSDGSTVACSLAVVGIGIDLSLDFANELTIDDGIVTDEFCRTNVPNVYAAGDVARSFRPRYGRALRTEHFDNAQLQGEAAAQAMCDKPAPYDPIAFFWSDQYDYALQYYGNAAAWDRVVLRGTPADGSFEAFYLNAGRLEAVCIVNRSRDANLLKRLLGRTDISPESLADDTIPLKTLLT